MKRCHGCNLDFPDDLRYCLSCGNPLAETGSITVNPSQATQTDRETFIRCSSCKNFVRADARVCEHCGAGLVEGAAAPTSSRPEPPPTRQIQPKEWYADTEFYQPTTGVAAANVRREIPPTRVAGPTTPVRNEKTAPSLSGLEAYGTTRTVPSSFQWWHGALLLLFVLVFAGGLGAGGWWWWSSRNSAAESNAAPSPSASPTSGSMTDVNKKSVSRSADDELKELRARRISARPADATTIVAELEDAERKYPADYRFPYERAKLSIKGVISHHEAFEALFDAAEKAIDNGKAQEMLNDLMSDKDGDFYKTSRGHHEWESLVEALRNNDKTHLKGGH